MSPNYRLPAVMIAVHGLVVVANAAAAHPAVTDERSDRTASVTIVLRGADEEADLQAMLKSLRSDRQLKLQSEAVSTGFRRFNNRFSTPMVLKMSPVPGDDDVHVGRLAEVVSATTTKNRAEHPPGVNLILFTDDAITEESVSALRSALSSVNGIDVEAAGGLGANIAEGWFWVRLDNEGGAMLNDVLQNAARSGVKLRTLQNPTADAK
ncbi:MAG: hypothetical protein Fues2KO_01240 [Fuerstiella sp.]